MNTDEFTLFDKKLIHSKILWLRYFECFKIVQIKFDSRNAKSCHYAWSWHFRRLQVQDWSVQLGPQVIPNILACDICIKIIHYEYFKKKINGILWMSYLSRVILLSRRTNAGKVGNYFLRVLSFPSTRLSSVSEAKQIRQK